MEFCVCQGVYDFILYFSGEEINLDSILLWFVFIYNFSVEVRVKEKDQEEEQLYLRFLVIIVGIYVDNLFEDFKCMEI